MAKLKHKPVVYPTARSEFHITTPTGVISAIFEDRELALTRFAKCPSSWRLIEVTLLKNDVTPADHDKTAPMQLRIAGNVPLALCA